MDVYGESFEAIYDCIGTTLPFISGKTYYTCLAIDLSPSITDMGVSMVSLDPAVFPLYSQLKHLHGNKLCLLSPLY